MTIHRTLALMAIGALFAAGSITTARADTWTAEDAAHLQKDTDEDRVISQSPMLAYLLECEGLE